MDSLKQWFSTFALKGAKSRLTTLLESRTKKFLTQVNWHVLCHSRTKSVTQNVRNFIERLLRAAQQVFGSRMRLSEQWLRATGLEWYVQTSHYKSQETVLSMTQSFKCRQSTKVTIKLPH